jgi:acylphosphatase
MHHLRLIAQGRVQGVGYRFFVHREAVRLKLHGIVRNLPDGDVEIVAEGERAALEQLVRIASEPPRGHVTNVHVHWDEGPGRYDGFRTA